MSLEDTDTKDLLIRFDYLVDLYVKLARDLVPLFDRFGKTRRELQLLTAELKNRGAVANNKEDLEKIIINLMEEHSNNA